MTSSVFSSTLDYLRKVLRGARSVMGSCSIALPYLFGWGENRKEVTEQYPDPVSSRTEDDLPPKTRGLLYNDIERCTGCGDCQQVCPVNCIEIESEPGEARSKTWVAVFNIDFGKCLFCGLCVDVCEPNSLVHSRQFEGAAYQVDDLVTSFGRGQLTEDQRERWREMRKVEEMDHL